MGEVKGRVCVTGGTGFVASWLVRRLLQHGYSVNATVRPPPSSGERKKKDIEYLTSLPGASENLAIFEADLTNPVSFYPAVQGCTGVFHVAHPIDTLASESEESITQRAIDGVVGVLRACLHSNTVKRVVYTSSIAAIVYNNAALASPSEPLQVDESSWTDMDFVKAENGEWRSYAISKTMAEKAGEEYAEKHGVEWVAVHPSFVTGPFLTPSLPTSVFISLALIFGNTKVYHYLMNLNMVHVDDLARAHIHLLEYPEAKGRYIVSSAQMQLLQMSDYLATRYSDLYQKQDDSLKGIKPPFMLPKLCTKKLLETGFEFNYGIDEIFDDAIRCCKHKGVL